MLNLVEIISDQATNKQAPCAHGNIVAGHACYCHNDKSPDRKCGLWQACLPDGEWSSESCEFFEMSRKYVDLEVEAMWADHHWRRDKLLVDAGKEVEKFRMDAS